MEVCTKHYRLEVVIEEDFQYRGEKEVDANKNVHKGRESLSK